MLGLGRRIWHIVAFEGIKPFVVGPKVIISEKVKILPAGKIKVGDHWVDRKRTLIQVYTDPGGMQTLAAAEIRLEDPGRTGR